MLKKNFVLDTIVMGGLSLALVMGSSACSSNGGGSGTGNGFADSTIGSSQGAETEGALLSMIDGSEITASTVSSAASLYASNIDDACAVADADVVTITFPCDTFLPNITSGVITATFHAGIDPAVTFVTTETLTTEGGAEIDINSGAFWVEATLWTVNSSTQVVFGNATSTTSGEYDIETGDPCSDITGEASVTLDLPELADIPGADALEFAITYGNPDDKASYSVCNDGTCPDGQVSIGSTGFSFTMVFDGTASATVTVGVTGQADKDFPVTLQCTPRE